MLLGRSFATQKIELICRLAAYNVDRMVTLFLFIFEGFLQSLD